MARPPGSQTRPHPRITRRRRTIDRLRRRKLASMAAAVTVAGLAAWVVVWSPLLRVDGIKVVGGAKTSSRDVAEATGLGPEDHILTISTAEVEARAETLPWVKSAQVDRVLPGTVRVRIVERKPAVTLSVGAAEWMVDITGRVLGPGPAGERRPTLAGAGIDGVVPGRPVASQPVLDALSAWRSFSPRLRREIAAIFAPTLERITFVLSSGTQIRYGAAEDLAAKNAVLEAILAELAGRAEVPGYIDVRVPRHPAVGAPAAAPATPSPTPT